MGRGQALARPERLDHRHWERKRGRDGHPRRPECDGAPPGRRQRNTQPAGAIPAGRHRNADGERGRCQGELCRADPCLRPRRRQGGPLDQHHPRKARRICRRLPGLHGIPKRHHRDPSRPRLRIGHHLREVLGRLRLPGHLRRSPRLLHARRPRRVRGRGGQRRRARLRQHRKEATGGNRDPRYVAGSRRQRERGFLAVVAVIEQRRRVRPHSRREPGQLRARLRRHRPVASCHRHLHRRPRPQQDRHRHRTGDGALPAGLA